VEDRLRCAEAFRIAERRGVAPLAVGEAADALEVRLSRCQLGLFGYGEKKRIVAPADAVTPELEQAIREGMILDRLPCAAAWAVATRFGIARLDVANAAETLGIGISECQLGAF
jgi:hypothetical protein